MQFLDKCWARASGENISHIYTDEPTFESRLHDGIYWHHRALCGHEIIVRPSHIFKHEDDPSYLGCPDCLSIRVLLELQE